MATVIAVTQTFTLHPLCSFFVAAANFNQIKFPIYTETGIISVLCILKAWIEYNI